LQPKHLSPIANLPLEHVDPIRGRACDYLLEDNFIGEDDQVHQSGVGGTIGPFEVKKTIVSFLERNLSLASVWRDEKGAVRLGSKIAFSGIELHEGL
jgi:hypothetical protein